MTIENNEIKNFLLNNSFYQERLIKSEVFSKEDFKISKENIDNYRIKDIESFELFISKCMHYKNIYKDNYKNPSFEKISVTFGLYFKNDIDLLIKLADFLKENEIFFPSGRNIFDGNKYNKEDVFNNSLLVLNMYCEDYSIRNFEKINYQLHKGFGDIHFHTHTRFDIKDEHVKVDYLFYRISTEEELDDFINFIKNSKESLNMDSSSKMFFKSKMLLEKI